MTTMMSARAEVNRAQADRGFQAAEQGGVLWAALCDDAGAAVMIVSGAGIIRALNTGAAGVLGAEQGDYVGRPLAELIGESVAPERIAAVEEAVTTGRAVMIDGMVLGRFVRMTVRPLESVSAGGLALVVARLGTERVGPAAAGVRRAVHDDMGVLGALTVREMEILKLIGLGLSTPAVAEKLNRSVKTVEWHRVSLGEKLGITNRVELARIAIGAGLVGTETGLVLGKRAAPAA